MIEVIEVGVTTRLVKKFPKLLAALGPYRNGSETYYFARNEWEVVADYLGKEMLCCAHLWAGELDDLLDHMTYVAQRKAMTIKIRWVKPDWLPESVVLTSA